MNKENSTNEKRFLAEVRQYINSEDNELLLIAKNEYETNGSNLITIKRIPNNDVKIEINIKEIRTYDGNMHGGDGMELIDTETI